MRSMPSAADGAWRRDAAGELGRDEDVHFVDGAHVEQRAEQSAAAFDQHVGHAAAAEFVEQAIAVASSCVSPGAAKNFDAGGGQVVGMHSAAASSAAATSTGTSPAVCTSRLSSDKRCRRIDDDPRGDAFHDRRGRRAGR